MRCDGLGPVSSLFFFLETPEPPPPLTATASELLLLRLRHRFLRFSPLMAASISVAGEPHPQPEDPNTPHPKFQSLLRRLHHGQPRRRRLRGAADSPAPPRALFFAGELLLLRLRRPLIALKVVLTGRPKGCAERRTLRPGRRVGIARSDGFSYTPLNAGLHSAPHAVQQRFCFKIRAMGPAHSPTFKANYFSFFLFPFLFFLFRLTYLFFNRNRLRILFRFQIYSYFLKK
jgi:hypothetical protein